MLLPSAAIAKDLLDAKAVVGMNKVSIYNDSV